MTCEECDDTGYMGDNGPGIKGNGEYYRCDCRIGDSPQMRLADEEIIRLSDKVCDLQDQLQQIRKIVTVKQ